jgi:hypothetical protein
VEFICKDPTATVRAANVRATIEAFTLVPSVGRRIAARHQLEIDRLTPDRVVPVQRWLDALKEIQSTVGAEVVRNVGRRIILNAHFPSQFPTVESILRSLDAIYYLNHKGEVGHYECTPQAGALVIRFATPYPRYFERGLIEGICGSRIAVGRRYSVSFEGEPPGRDVTCTITVRPAK